MTEPRVLIVGAGPAGIRAAATLVSAGLRPTVIDEGDRCGGQIYRQPPDARRRPYKTLYGWEAGAARALHDTFDRLRPAIAYHPRTLVWNITADAVHIHDRSAGGVGQLPYSHLILATGATDRVIPLPGWTTPGVYTLGGAQIALKAQDCLIGRRVCFVGTGPLLYLVALQYARAGATVAAVVETSPLGRQMRHAAGLRHAPLTALKGLSFMAELALRRVPVLRGAVPLGIEGDTEVSGLRLRHRGRERLIACEAVALGHGLRSETQLADLAGVPRDYDARQHNWVPRVGIDGRTSRAGVYAAGDGAGIQGARAAELRGTRAALAVLEDLGRPVDAALVARAEAALGRWSRFRAALDAMFPVPVEGLPDLADSVVVCRCEHITAGDIRRAIALTGAEDLNRVKSFSRAGMGRCQSRYCGGTTEALVAAATGRAPAVVGVQRSQPPIKPIPLEDLLRPAPGALPLDPEAVA